MCFKVWKNQRGKTDTAYFEHKVRNHCYFIPKGHRDVSLPLSSLHSAWRSASSRQHPPSASRNLRGLLLWYPSAIASENNAYHIASPPHRLWRTAKRKSRLKMNFFTSNRPLAIIHDASSDRQSADAVFLFVYRNE